MKIYGIKAFSDNYIWTIVNEKNHLVICVDPGDATPVLDFLEKNHLHLDTILITHHHEDHIGGIPQLRRRYPEVTIYAPFDDRIPFATSRIRAEDIIHVQPYDFRILAIPGHTSSHIAYQEPNQNWLFCGDTLFSAGCGRVFDGTMQQLYESLQQLKNLPASTQVYCAHEYTRDNLAFAQRIEPDNQQIISYLAYLDQNLINTTLPSSIGLEIQINPFLHPEKLQHFAQVNGLNISNPIKIFEELRNAKNHFTL
jgi:hydroxyacylglutathione hydrolase